MQHQEQQQQLALAISTSALVVLDVRCVASELEESTRGLASAPPRTLRHDSAAVESMAGRASHVSSTDFSGQAAVPVSGTVARRPEHAWTDSYNAI